MLALVICHAHLSPAYRIDQTDPSDQSDLIDQQSLSHASYRSHLSYPSHFSRSPLHV
jgi:hypothetical protein